MVCGEDSKIQFCKIWMRCTLMKKWYFVDCDALINATMCKFGASKAL